MNSWSVNGRPYGWWSEVLRWFPVTGSFCNGRPPLTTAFGVLILIGPLSALVCLIEIYIRWLIGLLLPNSPVGLLPGRPSFSNRGSLLVSSLATYALMPLLYVFLDTYVMPAGCRVSASQPLPVEICHAHQNQLMVRDEQFRVIRDADEGCDRHQLV